MCPPPVVFSEHQLQGLLTTFPFPFQGTTVGGEREKYSGFEAAALKPRLIPMLRRVGAALAQPTGFD